VIEVHTEDHVRSLGLRPSRWFTAESGLFSASPHLCLFESAWIEEQRAAVERYFVIDARSAAVSCFSITSQAYSAAEYDELLSAAGFSDVRRYPSLLGSDQASGDGLFVLAARH